jgi:bifunctional UDP-N-acetylglucosamine pyrophosphorylase/glucosamine-1-phosphate N-acetyltransferase
MPAPIAVVLAAGQGTRMRSQTPKVLHPICGVPMVLWPVRAALEAGAGKVVVVGGPDRALESILPPGVELAVQAEPLGTGDAVRAAAPHREDPAATVLVLNGDVPLITADAIRALIDAHAADGAQATVTTMLLDDPAGYGRVVRGDNGSLARIVETKNPGDATAEELAIREVNAGIYAFDAGPLADALDRLTTDNAQGELYLTDAVAGLSPRVRPHLVDDPTLTLGINDRADLAAVTRLAQQRILRRHMLAGVTIVDPASTIIEAGATIGQDTVIEPFTTIKGKATIGARCRIAHSYIDSATVEDDVSIGPFAYLRPGAVLRNRSKAGTFVEIKNSDIGEGSKVPHLSYIGDADVGPGSNLGASTVTANYDGKTKSRTTIGARVFTSVDTTLVAPVTLGDGSHTGAGSVINEDVPPGALGIARPRQTNIANYAEKRAKR